jgi:catechol 2,3-dioxygenase-like lactoylglutathione lyase family enzyme
VIPTTLTGDVIVIDHLSIGVADLPKTRAFYDATLGALGYERLSDGDDAIAYGPDTPVLWLCKAPHPVAPDPESGLHLCFKANDRASVDAFHRAALGAGGADNGPPGPRPAYGPTYYAAYVTDPDGYRIEAVCYA